MNALSKKIIAICCTNMSFLCAIDVFDHQNPLIDPNGLKKDQLVFNQSNSEPVILLFRESVEHIRTLTADIEQEINQVPQEKIKPIPIEVTVGKKFIIELPANPSTGYAWYWLINDPLKRRSVELVKKEYFSQSVSLGGEGVVRFTFKAMRVSSMHVILYKKRLWEKNSDIDMRWFDVTVHCKRHYLEK